MFVLNIIDSKELKMNLRKLFVNHHSEYDFVDPEEEFCDLIELTKSDILLIESEYEDVQGRYILNHILKFCHADHIKKVIVIYDDVQTIPLELKAQPHFDIEYHAADRIDDSLLERMLTEPSVEAEETTSKTVERKSILYVSDDHFMQIIVQDIIHKNTSYDILTANDGVEGLEKYTAYHPNLVLTDLIMPEIDGMELCKQIKVDNGDEQTEVIIFSSTSDEDTIEQAYRLKARAYIVKPIRPEQFLRKINRILA